MEYRTIPYYTDYIINNKGDVFSTKFNRLKRLKHTKTLGYHKVRLCMDNKPKMERVHRLVLMAFDRMPKKGEVARHFPDNDKSNNHISNLRWGTAKQNSYDRDKIHKTLVQPKGENSTSAKLTDKQVLEIIDLHKTGNFYQRELADKYSVCRQHISAIVNNKSRTLKI